MTSGQANALSIRISWPEELCSEVQRHWPLFHLFNGIDKMQSLTVKQQVHTRRWSRSVDTLSSRPSDESRG